MKIKKNMKAGGRSYTNHNQTLVRDVAKGMKVKTRLKAGKLCTATDCPNHNETLVRDRATPKRART